MNVIQYGFRIIIIKIAGADRFSFLGNPLIVKYKNICVLMSSVIFLKLNCKQLHVFKRLAIRGYENIVTVTVCSNKLIIDGFQFWSRFAIHV